MRIYDPRLGRFLSVDPLTKRYPELTPYQFASNSPVANIDLDGLERHNFNLVFAKDGKTIIGISSDKVIEDWFEDLIHGQRFRLLDPNTKTLYEFEFDNEAELKKFVTGKSLSDIREISRKIFDQKVFFATAYTVASALENDILTLDKQLSSNTGDLSKSYFKGSLSIEDGADYSLSELEAANYMKSLGKDVTIRKPTGTTRTSDLYVNASPYDVFTPETNNINRLVSAIAKKNSQATGIVLDLSKTTITENQLGNLLKRVQGAGAKNIKEIVVMPKK